MPAPDYVQQDGGQVDHGRQQGAGGEQGEQRGRGRGEDGQDDLGDHEVQHGGLQRGVGARRDLLPVPPAGEAGVAGHRPDQPAAGHHDDQPAGEDRQHDEDQQQGRDGGAEDMLDDVGDPGGGLGQGGRVGDGEGAPDQEDETDRGGGDPSPAHGPGHHSLGI